MSDRATALVELFRASPDLLALTDPGTRVIEEGAAWAAALGFAPGELLGVMLADLVVREDRERLSDAVARALSGQRTTLEVRLLAKYDQAPAALGLAVASTRDRDLLAIFAHDLTATRASEERLAAAERRLQELRRLESVALLAGGIVHHVNNLFCVSMGYLKMLADEVAENAAARGYLAEVQGATDRAAELVRQLLGLARESDAAASVEVVDAVRRLELLLRQLVTEQVEFLVDISAPKLPEVRGGRAQLDQLVVNLAFAARELMADGGTLRVTARFDDLSGGQVVSLSFTHRARPSRPAPRIQLVEPLPGWAARFGLPAAQQLVAQMGGQLLSVTEADGAVTRTARLPVAVQAPEDTRARPPGAPAQETILLVEDEEKLRALILRSLKRQGYGVLVAADGEQAMRVSREHPGRVDLLLTDVVMPGISGMDLAGQLLTSRPDLRVLYISGHGEAAVGATAPAPGRMEVLEKPFRPGALMQRVRALLDR